MFLCPQELAFLNKICTSENKHGPIKIGCFVLQLPKRFLDGFGHILDTTEPNLNHFWSILGHILFPGNLDRLDPLEPPKKCFLNHFGAFWAILANCGPPRTNFRDVSNSLIDPIRMSLVGKCITIVTLASSSLSHGK